MTVTSTNMAASSDSSESTVRRRRVDGRKTETDSADSCRENGADSSRDTDTEKRRESVQTGTFWLTRIVLLRSVAFIYLVAFSVAYNQNKQLIGEHGLMPCKSYLNSVKRYVGGKVGMAALAYTPSILWFLDWDDMDANLDGIALVGMALSAFVLVTGMANMVIMVTLWVLYHSLVNVGQLWYSFGWESQLLETGFLAIFLCPVWTLSQVPRRCPPSLTCIWTFRWLIVRIMLGAGLIKIRGDKCWRDLTCMDYHYETQPVPNPLSYYMHRSPWWFHRFETLSNHFIELIVPFFTFLGRRMCMVNGAIQILFQVVLIVSGNLSFLNWLTIVPSLACFDDASLSFMFRSGGGAKKAVLEIQNEDAAGRTPKPTKGMLIRRVVNISLGILIGFLSIPVVMNLISSRQVMNTSFDPLRIVNTYGAFGSITKERTEVIFQGTLNPDPKDPEAVWEEYQFQCKPGDIYRRPCLISPYHYRLDWLMWFAAFQTYEQSEWVIHIAGRLLSNDSTVLSLLDHNPFQGRDPPRWVRGEHFRYKFSPPGSASAAQGKWWLRKRIGAYFPPVDLEGLRGYFQSRNWPHPHIPPNRS
ncbi:lipase maturation factor 1 isoform X2 [Lates calcarifer]|uniref:Lipase maturation factor n=1 Tax=Lates calcarifer TaxID=8187 RepID=A0A4W6EDX2_LATCA|nr:lipase maturation factor 1 isoform X2 [Lates calcarifer]XP_050922096.1 lipase maturation factor 1 isoform X2 [Lates calcarifer]